MYKLAVFDLDFTVWDAGGVWCDCLRPPFTSRAGRIVDSAGSEVRIYDGIAETLERLQSEGVALAIASRTSEPSWARRLLDLSGLRSYFSYEEIYPTSKLRHFSALQDKSGFAYEEMIFFDDERRNIDEVGGLGVRSIWVQNGFTPELFADAWELGRQ